MDDAGDKRKSSGVRLVMRGRKKRSEGMKLGRTIVAEREYAESEQDRLTARKRARRKKGMSFFVLLLMLGTLGLLMYIGFRQLTDRIENNAGEGIKYMIRAEVIDENQREKISIRMEEYIALLEQDFRDAGYVVTRVVLPANTSRELYVSLEGINWYFKINMDRGTAMSVEDAVRMMRYLEGKEVTPEYVDVRVEGKGYYR